MQDRRKLFQHPCRLIQQFIKSLMRCCADGTHPASHTLAQRAHPFQVLVCTGKIRLVAHNDLRPLAQIAVAVKLGIDLVQVLQRIPALAAGDIDNMQQKPGALNMPEKIVAKACTVGSPLDQAGISARTISFPKRRTIPRLGVRVVK